MCTYQLRSKNKQAEQFTSRRFIQEGYSTLSFSGAYGSKRERERSN